MGDSIFNNQKYLQSMYYNQQFDESQEEISNSQPSQRKKLKQMLSAELFKEIEAQNFRNVKNLIDQGADVNQINYKNSNAWYAGNTSTPLYVAIHADFQKYGFKSYLNIIEYLLLNGADTKFEARIGGWNGSSTYPLLHNISSKVVRMETSQNMISFFKLLCNYGVNINQTQVSRSYKRCSSSHSSLLMRLMDQNCMPSKINQLIAKNETESVYKLQKEQQSRLRRRFNQENGITDNNNNNNENNNNRGNQNQPQLSRIFLSQQNQTQKVDVEVIKALIQLGADANSTAGHYYCQNYRFDDDDDDGDELKARIFNYFNRRDRKCESVLHRAITNNQADVVRLLLQKGARVSQDLQYTIEVPFYPHEWPSQLKQWTIRENTRNLHEQQKSKMQLKKALNTCNVELQKQKIKQRLLNVEFKIFKAVNFSIESQVPLAMSQAKSLTCLELTKQFNASQQIISLLQNPSKIKQLEYKNGVSQKNLLSEDQQEEIKQSEEKVEPAVTKSQITNKSKQVSCKKAKKPSKARKLKQKQGKQKTKHEINGRKKLKTKQIQKTALNKLKK